MHIIGRHTRRVCLSFLIPLVGLIATCLAQQKRIYIANDDHTDYMWSADEATYKNEFVGMLDYYVNQSDSTSGLGSDFQGRFNADGNFWLWTYQKNTSSAQFQHLMDRVRDGHITIPLQTLVLIYGAMPAEAVLRSMYYAGRIERQFDARFYLVSAMENQTLPFGLPSLWAGTGAKYSWRGVCACLTSVPGLSNRGREIYRAIGPDGQSVVMKWHSLYPGNNQESGGYAEARNPASSVTFASSNPTFLARYPFDQVVGMFGKGWDDVSTYTTEFMTTAQTMSNASRRVIVSNEVDFFDDFVASAPADSLPSYAAGFGNEWDVAAASLAEVTASVRRSVESLRTAEALATFASAVNSSFMTLRAASADSAFTDIGLYFEHNFIDPAHLNEAARATFQRRVATQFNTYVSTLQSDASALLAAGIQQPSGTTRFFVFNPLGHTRTDIADIATDLSAPLRVIDVTSGQEIHSQLITKGGQQYIRILSENVPSVGYRVFEIQQTASQFVDTAVTFSNGNSTFENDKYRVTVDGRGAITSLIDKRDANRELVQNIGGLTMNDIGTGSGSPAAENAGSVSATILVSSSGSPSHTTRVTLYRIVDRVDIENEITQNFGSGEQTYSFGFNISGYTVRHEEVGAIATAKLLSQGGSYSNDVSRYDFFTMNHFVDLSNVQRGITLSNWESPFFRLGNSSGMIIDGSSPQVKAIVGTQIDGHGYNGQNGDSYFKNRYALQRHGVYDQAAAMRMALEHQNPLGTGYLSGGTGPFPPTSYSMISMSNPNVMLWSVKPSEEGITNGIVARVWNMSENSQGYSLFFNGALTDARKTTHIETNTGSVSFSSSSISDNLPTQRMQTYRLVGTPTFQSNQATVRVALKILLDGAYDSTAHLMTRILNTSGALGAHFTSVPIPAFATDSINIEIRNAAAGAVATTRKYMPAWLMNDGTIRSFSDTTKTYVEFDTLAGNYYVVVRHRNHLPVMTVSAQPLSGFSPPAYDFTASQSSAYGANAMKQVGSVFAIYGGDADANLGIGASDIVGARQVVGSIGYSVCDFDMNAGVGASDIVLARSNIGQISQVP